MQQITRTTRRVLELAERVRITVIARHIAKLIAQRREGRLVHAVVAVLAKAGGDPFDQPLPGPGPASDADDRARVPAAPNQVLHSRNDLLVREVTGDPEDHERIREGFFHALVSDFQRTLARGALLVIACSVSS